MRRDIYKIKFALACLVMGFVFLHSINFVIADIHPPVNIEPYDEQSIATINRSFFDLKSYTDKLAEESASLIAANNDNQTNPTPEKAATVVELTGQVMSTTVTALNMIIQSTAIVIPEMTGYRQYLQHIMANMESRADNQSYTKYGKNLQVEITKVDDVLKALASVQVDMKEVITIVSDDIQLWILNYQATRAGNGIFKAGKIEVVYKDTAEVLRNIHDMRKIIHAQISFGYDDNYVSQNNEENAYNAAKKQLLTMTGY